MVKKPYLSKKRAITEHAENEICKKKKFLLLKKMKEKIN